MDSRPLSPHLQVYRPQLTSVLSITHRATGVYLSLGAFALTYWLLALASGPESYAEARECLGAWPFQLMLVGWIFSFYYHLCNGIRHLFWDIGKGFEIDTLYKSGYAVLIVSIVLSCLTVYNAFSGGAA